MSSKKVTRGGELRGHGSSVCAYHDYIILYRLLKIKVMLYRDISHVSGVFLPKAVKWIVKVVTVLLPGIKLSA